MEPFTILKEADTIMSLYNRVSQELIPWSRVKTKKEEDKTWFSVKSEASKAVLFPKKAVSDRRRMMAFCNQFPYATRDVKKAEVKSWPKPFCTVSSFLDNDIDPDEYPMDREDMLSMFSAIGAGCSVKMAKLSPSVVAFLDSYSDVVACLPPKQFNTDVVPSLFGVHSDKVKGMSQELAAEEHTARMNLLANTVIFSTIQGFCSLAKNSVAPSPLEAAAFSLLSGVWPFLVFSWSQSYLRFCKARVALRYSLFKYPYHRLVTQVVSEDPFSRELFSKEAIKKAYDEFYKDDISWESLLKLKFKKSGQAPRNRPARRPALRYHPYRRGGGSYRGAREQDRQGNNSNNSNSFRGRQPFSRRGGRKNRKQY